MNDVPLIWTTKGNVPVDSLEYTAKWYDTAENIKLVETYVLAGEVVKQNAHILVKEGAASNSTQGGFS